MTFEESMRPSDRYVLVKASSDGTPTSVRPMPNLATAREELKLLDVKERGWYVFDIQENRPVETTDN